MAATAPPSAKEPTRLITMEALYLLWKRKPVQAPDIDGPKTLSSAEIMQSKSCYNFENLTSNIKLWTNILL